MEQNVEEPMLELHVDYARNILGDTTRWTRFIAIMGFIATGVLLLVLFLLAFAGEAMSSVYARYALTRENAEVFVIGLVFLLVLLVGFLAFMLLRFSRLLRRGMNMQDQDMFNNGLKALRVYFTCAGILGVITLVYNIYTLIKVL